jgi:hypothetical protein
MPSITSKTDVSLTNPKMWSEKNDMEASLKDSLSHQGETIHQIVTRSHSSSNSAASRIA